MYGHIGHNTLLRQVHHRPEIGIKGPIKPFRCSICLTSRARRKNIPRTSSKKEPLEVIATDVQGPFRIQGSDGSKFNIKFIDAGTKYLKTETISNVTADNAIQCFKRFQARMERRMNRKIQNVQCDSGVEYQGAFLDHLISEGIVKRKGEAYAHHYPGLAENANNHILYSAKPKLKASQLPMKYYSDAILDSSYMWNRIVHHGCTTTPWEKVHGKSPNLKHLVPFGCIGYAFVPIEKRSKFGLLGKLEDNRVRCRRIGYGDDDDSEEYKGYKILVEAKEPYIDYSTDVIWDISAPMTPVTEFDSYEDKEFDTILPEGDISSDYTPETEDREDTDDLESNYYDAEDGFDNDLALLNLDVEALTKELGVIPKEAAKKLKENNQKLEDSILAENYTFFASQDPLTGLTPELYMYAFLALTDGVPVTYNDAMASDEKVEWLKAIESEYKKIKDADTWQLQHLPTDGKKRNIIRNRWVFKKKMDHLGNVIEYKARFVAKGFTQKYGVDFQETFAPVAKLKSIRMLTAIAASLGLNMYQDDVPSAFLKGTLSEELWMAQPEGFDDGSGRYCRMKKTLYGLKQSPREWNAVIHQFLIRQGFQSTISDSCIYVKREGNEVLLCALYVDDIITVGKPSKLLTSFRHALHREYKIAKGGDLIWYLGCHFTKGESSWSIDQNLYVKQKLAEFESVIGTGMRSTLLPSNYDKLLEEAEESTEYEENFPYRNMVGSLMYAMVGTRLDIAFAVSIVSRHLSNPKRIHCDMVRHIFQYLRANPCKSIHYKLGCSTKLEGFCDASYANQLGCKSTSGYAFTLGTGVISWYSKRQSTVALSSSEAEYIAACEATKEALWFKQLLKELGFEQGTVPVYEDNEAAILLSKNPQHHGRTKHIQIQFHWIREQVSKKFIELLYVPTAEQLADCLTKQMGYSQMTRMLIRLGVLEAPRELKLHASSNSDSAVYPPGPELSQ